MAVYYSTAAYIEDAETTKDKINRIDNAIDALWSQVMKAVENDDVQSYSLDNGQTSISVTYRSTMQVMNSIKFLEMWKNKYIKRLNGHQMIAKDSRNLRYRY